MDYFKGLNVDQVAGIDEAGRGPLAGPVVAAAVILSPDRPIEGLNDSKKLSEKRRDFLFDIIMEQAHAVGIGQCSHLEIDRLNILQATMVAMQRAYNELGCSAKKVFVDGNRTPQLPVESEAIIKGDQKLACISASSIIAKVTRDRQMLLFSKKYPEYHFNQHKGYGTKLHIECLYAYGPSPIHRRSFSPVRQAASSCVTDSVE